MKILKRLSRQSDLYVDSLQILMSYRNQRSKFKVLRLVKDNIGVDKISISIIWLISDGSACEDLIMMLQNAMR